MRNNLPKGSYYYVTGSRDFKYIFVECETGEGDWSLYLSSDYGKTFAHTYLPDSREFEIYSSQCFKYVFI